MTGKSKTFFRGDKLTAEEIAIFHTGCCPDCSVQDLLAGPQGGFAQNVKCGNPECESLFNDEWAFGIERLTDASPLKLPERRTAYRN